jgi:spermidine/putrescine transport system substrate-binding protein
VTQNSADLEAMLKRIAETRINRRGFLAAAGYSSVAAFLAACATSGSSTAPSTSAAAPSSAPSVAPSVAASASPTPAPSYKTETELIMYNWSDYVSKKNMADFKKEYGVTKFQYDIFDNNDALMAKLQGGAKGYDIAAPTNNYVPAMVDGGFLQKLDMSRIPNMSRINPTFRKQWWDPNEEYCVPKDYGTTGILYRSTLIPSVPKTWREFYDMIKGPASGKVIFVDSRDDVFIFPLKMLGFSLNSVEKDELDQARTVLLDVAPHLYGLDSNLYGRTMADGTASMTLGWTGPLGQELKDTPDKGYVVPSEGTAFWLDVWVMLADAPHPNISYAWLDFIHRPEVQAEETNYNLYATPNDDAKKFVDPKILADTAIFPPDDVISKLEAQKDTSASTQRNDIWEEFKSKVGG